MVDLHLPRSVKTPITYVVDSSAIVHHDLGLRIHRLPLLMNFL